MNRLLIVEDDENLSRGIAFAFEKDGYSVISANTLKAGQLSFEQQNINIVILDLGLPDGNGMEFCRSIREKSSTPIIMLTACDMETDEVAGLTAGADDYVTKPFSLSVLRARVEAVLRRMEAKENHIIQSGGYRLDTTLCKFFKRNEEITISATEFRLLNYFIANAGQVLAKQQILAALWDNQGNFVDENTLSVNISRLRAKIEDDPKKPVTLKTIHGMGYVWVKE
ncbi:MAG: response regulator transcription factor [Oscillospiraceae bacterium]|nr:response regulator transcription factor [Oscillospiraceae bacterium]